MWAMFAFLLFIPVKSLGPETKTKAALTFFTTVQYFPASLPAIFMQTLPISSDGIIITHYLILLALSLNVSLVHAEQKYPPKILCGLFFVLVNFLVSFCDFLGIP